MKVLLVIDMQQGSFTPQTPRHDAGGVVERINQLAGIMRQSNGKVIFIQHNGTRDNEFLPGTPDWKLLPSLTVKEEDILIDKTANDCFYNSVLDSTLKQLAADELIVTGCATDFCVDTTIRSALAKDYNITVISNGHTTANRDHLNAETVIAHHNWVWQNMIPTKGKIKVLSLSEYLLQG